MFWFSGFFHAIRKKEVNLQTSRAFGMNKFLIGQDGVQILNLFTLFPETTFFKVARYMKQQFHDILGKEG